MQTSRHTTTKSRVRTNGSPVAQHAGSLRLLSLVLIILCSLLLWATPCFAEDAANRAEQESPMVAEKAEDEAASPDVGTSEPKQSTESPEPDTSVPSEKEDEEETDSELQDTESPVAASEDEEEEEEEEDSADAPPADVKNDQPKAEKRTRPKRQTIGWVERIRLEPEGLLLDAKLTPGSEGNVLHAQKIKTFEKDGETWVRFKTKDRKGDMQMLERPVIETNRFRTTDGSISERYVVPSAICLGDVYVEIDFALSNRNAFEQEARIGRSTLAGQFIIDPSKTKTTKPRCSKIEE